MFMCPPTSQTAFEESHVVTGRSPLESTEEIAGGIADQRFRTRLPRIDAEAAHDGHGDPIELAHHELRRAGHLVGDGEDGRGERTARRIELAEIAPERRDAAGADGHVGESLAP